MVHFMSKKIKLYVKGDCVEVATYVHDTLDGFFVPARMIGLVVESELVQMGSNEQMNMHDEEEWMYRIILPDGRVTEVWDYEIRLVNTMATEYNNISHKPKGA